MPRFFREPLLHFLLLGAAILVAYSFLSRHDNGEPNKIVITQGEIRTLVAGFTQAWQRPPTEDELTGLINDRVREEVYFREAIALGLDKEDTVIRRRLRQKMEFFSDDIMVQREPTDAELNAYLQSHIDLFRIEPHFTFQQIYLNPERHGTHLARDAKRLLARLNHFDGRIDTSMVGDSSLIEHEFIAAPTGRIAKIFGEKFAATLSDLNPNHWYGPIESGYGQHLVLINDRIDGRSPKLAEAYDTVRREWESAQRQETNEKFYQSLLKRFAVIVEQPEPTTDIQKQKFAQK